MAWSMDLFAAKKAAEAGAQIRRAGWTTKYIICVAGLFYLVSGTTKTLVTATDFRRDEFNARDWTDQPFNADPCDATPTYNTTPNTYGQWTSAPVFLPPPPPGFVDES